MEKLSDEELVERAVEFKWDYEAGLYKRDYEQYKSCKAELLRLLAEGRKAKEAMEKIIVWYDTKSSHVQSLIRLGKIIREWEAGNG